MPSPMHPWRNASATVALLAATPFVHAQTIHTVDVEGRGDYADIQSAVDAASSGDVIYVMDPQATYDDEVAINAYAGFTIDGKSLSVVANPNGMWSVGSVTIRDLAEDQFVVLSGLPLGHDVVPPGSFGAPAGLGDAGARVTISDALGPVLLQHCAIVGRRASTALDVQRSTAVFVTSCEINTPWDAPTVHLSDCYCALDRSYVRGGQASTIHQYCSASLRDGFPGIVLAAGANLRLGSALIEGGLGEWVIEHGFPPKECYGSPGDPIAFSGGTLLIDVEYPEVPRLHAPQFVGVDDPLQLLVLAEAGSSAYLLISERVGFNALTPAAGPLIAGEPIPGGRRALGPGSSHWIDLPPLPLGQHARRLIVQVAVVGPLGIRLSGAREVLQLGEAAPILAPNEPVHIDPARGPGGNGRSWETALPTLREGIGRLAIGGYPGAEFWLRSGSHVLPDPAEGILRLPMRVAVRGGFAGTETSAGERVPGAPRSVFDLDRLGDDGLAGGSLLDNARGVFTSNGSLVISWEAWALNGAAVARRLDLDGLTLRGASSGNTFGAITGPYDRGSVVDCSFERISNLFTVVQAGDLVVERCRFIDNRARPLWNSAAYTECLFAGNVTQSPLLITNERGLRNCTIVGNQVPLGGIIGVQAGQPGAAFVRNSVIVGNQSAGTGGAAAHFQPGLSTGTWDLGYSLISGWIPAFGGVGMVVAPPRFRDPLGPDGVRFSGDEDYTPAPGSPLIDAGGPTDVPVLALPPSALDLEGRPRRVDDPATPDTGPGSPPVIDIGALEFQG